MNCSRGGMGNGATSECHQLRLVAQRRKSHKEMFIAQPISVAINSRSIAKKEKSRGKISLIQFNSISETLISINFIGRITGTLESHRIPTASSVFSEDLLPLRAVRLACAIKNLRIRP